MSRVCFAVILSVWLVSLTQVFAGKSPEKKALCPHWILVGHLDKGLSDVEKRLVCGDREAKPLDPDYAWKEIPYQQAKYHLSTFLQDRGYYSPIFNEPTKEEPNHIVDIGTRSFIKSWRIEGENYGVDVHQKRKVVGSPLTPSALNEIEKWVGSQLQFYGYACPETVATAFVENGEVVVKIKPGAQGTIASIEQEPIPGVVDGILGRYYPFKVGDTFNGNLLTLAETRVGASGVVESAHFRRKCEGSAVYLKNEIITGAPRLLLFSVGIDTESLITGKASWRNTRLGPRASLLDVTLSASQRAQSLSGNFQWYVFPGVPQVYINPYLQLFNRTSEPRFEFLSNRSQLGIGTENDLSGGRLKFFIGPTLELIRTLEGVGAPTSQIASIETRATLLSHGFEYFSGSPRAGYNLSLTGNFSNQGWGSSVTAQRLLLRGEGLLNVNNYDPPLWILGIRGGLSAVFTPESAEPDTRLPPHYLQYLGGAQNIRGFGRQELPNDTDAGGLMSAFIGLEGRLSHTLPFGIDPFTFIDFAVLGREVFQSVSPLYWSPGIGIRWASPIGSVRVTLAHGYSNFASQHNQFYFSLGDEF